MKDRYYQIKGKLSEPGSGLYGGSQNWSWPPVFSGMVSAETEKYAHAIINEEYSKKFPLRVLSADLDNNEFLLNISEVVSEHTRSLFELRPCGHCGTMFRVIDNYNNNRNSGTTYCSLECKNECYEIQCYVDSGNNELNGPHQPVIYCVMNIDTGLRYIGKTTQAFTLRWYQHFYQSGDTKFHQAIKTSPIEHWQFMVIEKIKIPVDIKSKSDIEKLILEREKHYIRLYDTMNNGYNSLC